MKCLYSWVFNAAEEKSEDPKEQTVKHSILFANSNMLILIRSFFLIKIFLNTKLYNGFLSDGFSLLGLGLNKPANYVCSSTQG